MLLSLVGCGDGVFTPARQSATQLALRPSFAVNGSSVADVHRIRVTISELPGGEQVDQQIFTVDPTDTEWNLDLPVPANSNLRLLIELMNETGTVLFSGVTDVRVTTGQQDVPEEIPVFPGPPENLSITSVTIDPRGRSLLEGEQFRLTANVVGGPASPVVTWASLNSGVATVASDGTVTAVGPGNAIITVFAGQRSDNVTVQVGARAARVDVTPASPVATSFGSDVAFTGRVLDARNAEVSGLGITWTIADATIATQMSPGVFRARRNGTTTVTATATQNGRTITGTATLKVEQRPVTLALDPATATLNAYGATVALHAIGNDANGNPVEGLTFTWTSSDANVAMVDANGVVTARANGVTTIRASAAGAFAEATITVAQSAATLTLTPNEATLRSVNETVQLQAELTDARGNVFTAPVVWTSSLPGVATVDQNGLVTARGDGQTVIGATAGGRRANATITVERQVASVTVDPASAELQVGTTTQLRAIVADANGFTISGRPITWASGNATVATVNSSGLVSGMHEGATFISASTGGVTGTANVTVTGGGVVVPGGPFTKMLIVSNVSYENDRFKTLLTPELPGITIDLTTSPLLLSQTTLAQYQVIMLFENSLFGPESPQVGDHLAQYVNNGGNLVIGTFYWQNRSDNPSYHAPGWGSLEAIDMFYAPPGMSSSEFSSKYEYRSAILDPASLVPHPLTQGVTSVSVASYPNGMAAKPGTTVVASYTNGAPLIGFVQRSLGQRLVGVAMFPSHIDHGGVTGDFMRIWRNALTWAATGGSPAGPPPSNTVQIQAKRVPVPVRDNGPKRGGTYDNRR